MLLLTAMLAPAAPAFAHAALVSSEPGAGYAVTTAPNEILLQFSEQVSLADDALTLTGPAGREVPLQVALDPTRTAVRGLLPDEIADRRRADRHPEPLHQPSLQLPRQRTIAGSGGRRFDDPQNDAPRLSPAGRRRPDGTGLEDRRRDE